MTIDSALTRFLKYLSAERNMAPRTIKAYGYDLERFVRYLAGKNPRAMKIARVEPYDLKDYLAFLQEEHQLKPATMSRTISSLRVFFAWAEKECIAPQNPARGLRSPKKPKRLPVYLMGGEVNRLATAPPPEHSQSFRDRTILVLLIMTGMRLSELVGLDLQHVDLETGTLRVYGKGRKERLIPLNDRARLVLRGWMGERPTSPIGCQALFLGRDGNRISRRTVQYLVRKAVKRSGLSPRISPHKLRHTFATNLYAQAVDLRDIQALLGHSSIASTSVYTHTNVDKVRAAVNKLKI